MLPAALAAEYLRQREALLAAFPELADDVQALADSLEGFTDAPDVIARFVRDAREDEALAGSLGNMLRDMGERKARLIARAERRRLAAQRLMEACQLRKIELADFTASIRAVPASVTITDETALPDSLCKFVRSPDKAAIKTALLAGPVGGAVLNSGGQSLTIRTR